MKILLTGATGYIGKRLLPVLLNRGYDVVCCVRDKNRFSSPDLSSGQITVIEVDFLDGSTLGNVPKDIDAAYYLIHSMSGSTRYNELELTSAINFRETVNKTSARHVVYLSGMVNESTLSEHLASRKAVELELEKGSYQFTTLRAGIIIGSGSASFEIMRDLAEKLPVMVAPKWLNTRCQPIGIRDVIDFLVQTLFNKATYNRNFDIGGPDIMTYKEMLLGYARNRGLKRWIFTVPVMTPKLSSYWLYFITSVSYRLAVALVKSMKVEVVCRDNEINTILNIYPVDYEQALKRTLFAVDKDNIPSSWKDALTSGSFKGNLSAFQEVPTHGCYLDSRKVPIMDRDGCISKIWRIGGQNGWYYATWLWKLRGYMDKLFGGVGLRRGRTHSELIHPGDAIDFWRVVYADRSVGRLLLFAEMKLPGEAWLEFNIRDNLLYQTATFRPKGLWGRLYWFSVYPLHGLVFGGMIRKLAT